MINNKWQVDAILAIFFFFLTITGSFLIIRFFNAISKTWHDGVKWIWDSVSATLKTYSKNFLTPRSKLFFIFVWLWILFEVISKTWRDGVKWTSSSVSATPKTYSKNDLTPRLELIFILMWLWRLFEVISNSILDWQSMLQIWTR